MCNLRWETLKWHIVNSNSNQLSVTDRIQNEDIGLFSENIFEKYSVLLLDLWFFHAQFLNILLCVWVQSLCVYMQSYFGKVALVVMSAKHVIPDPEMLSQYCVDALQEMKKAAVSLKA